MSNIAIVPNQSRDSGLIETRRLVCFLTPAHTVLLDETLCGERIEKAEYLPREGLLKKADFIVVLGGDGTILSIAADAAVHDVPIIGINLGTLGFLSQAERGDHSVFDDLFAGRYTIDRCMMLSISVLRDEKPIKQAIALNDAVLTGGTCTKMVNLSAAVNGTCIGSYSADGLIVASAVGSTAYSLSAGGAVLHPELDAMIITPICPHTLRARSMVIPGDACVDVRTEAPYRTQAVVTVDGRVFHTMQEQDTLRVTRSVYRTSLVRLEQRSFFDVLREKLSD